MAEPALALDAILVEASGFAEPLILARISRWGRSRFRLGRLIDVIDACEHFTTIDDGDLPRSARPRSPSPLLTSSTSSPTPSASRVWPSSASVCMPAIRGPRCWAQCSAASNRTCSSTALPLPRRRAPPQIGHLTAQRVGGRVPMNGMSGNSAHSGRLSEPIHTPCLLYTSPSPRD